MEVEEIEDTDYFNDDLVCSICFAEFLDREDLVVHINQFHIAEACKNRFCKLCTQFFPDVEEYSLHLRNKHFGNIKCCKHCFRLFNSTVEVSEHEKKHNITVLHPKISCSHCKHIFDDKDEMKNHELKAHKNSAHGFVLTDCLPTLSSILSMNVNDFLAAMCCNLPYICERCGKTTLDINIYIQHLIDKNCRCLVCDICCNVYVSKKKLQHHITQSHFYNDDIPNLYVLEKQCHKCKVPVDSTLLKSHLKTCTGMICVVCDLSFDSFNEYTAHKMAKHSTKSLSVEVCIYCQQQRVGAEAMKKHIERAHKNQKHLYKYCCTYCNRIFKHPKLLFAHFYTKHKDLHPYTCEICNQKFRIRKNFTLHIKLTHKSVGFVKFDDNFHVFFTDKELDINHENQEVCDMSVDKNDLNEEATCKIEVEIIQDNSNDVPIAKEPIKEVCLINPENLKDIKSNLKDNHKIVELNDENHSDQHLEDENLTKQVIDDVTTNFEIVEKPIKKSVLKRKRKVRNKVKIKHASDDTDIFSDDSDTPLKVICKKRKLQGTKMKKLCRMPLKAKSIQTQKFICNKCNRNCYTFQNYHRHKALHIKNETKVCIKCYSKFDSVKKLNEHIRNEHSSSKLTDTLKKLIEKRKKAEAITKHIVNAKDILHEVIPLSTTEKFRNTIKKVSVDKSVTKVTMKIVDKDKISVKKYLESFTPDNNEVKITFLNTSALDSVKIPRPFVKLTKFNQEHNIKNIQEGTLKMPVKFTDDLNVKCRVSIKLVSCYEPSTMRFDNPIASSHDTDDNYVNAYDDCDTYNSFEADTETVPEVAQEVMLVGAEERHNVVHSMNLKNLPAWHNVKIAHLAAEAPFFKISKINIEKDHTFTLVSDDREEDVPKDITLANGKKLVSANPFAHLLDTKAITELKKSKRKKCGYKPKLSNVAEAITKAMEKLDKAPSLR